MNEIELKVLETIKQNNGEYSWYQLDRVLSDSGVQHSGKLMEILRGLAAAGQIETKSGANPAQPLYSITDLGLSSLEQGEDSAIH